MNKVLGLVAKGCCERAKALGYRGKRREDYALDYWSGATMALVATEGLDSDSVKLLSRYGHLMIAPRGFREVEVLAERYDAELAEAQLILAPGEVWDQECIDAPKNVLG